MAQGGTGGVWWLRLKLPWYLRERAQLLKIITNKDSLADVMELLLTDRDAAVAALDSLDRRMRDPLGGAKVNT